MQYAERKYSLSRLYAKILFYIAIRMPFLKAEFRARIHKAAGVNILHPTKKFIGQGGFLDDICPEDITVEEGMFITNERKILTHFIDSASADIYIGNPGRVLKERIIKYKEKENNE